MQNTEEIYSRYADYVFKYLLSMSGSRDIAEEITQETFYQAIRSINRYDGSCSLSTWLCAIAKNRLAVYRRKNPPHEELDTAELTAASPEEEVIRGSEKTMLYTKLHALPEPYREILYLRLLANLSHREIGEILGMSENRARVMFYRAKEMLKKEIQNNG